MKAYVALFKSNMRLTLRDRVSLFYNYVFPLLFFFVFAGLFRGGGTGISFFVGTVLTMGILGNGLWGAGMRSVQEREANILRRFKVTPISPLPILTASLAAGWLLYMPVVLLVILVAHFGYAMPFPRSWFSLFLMVSLGVCSMRAIGLILAAVVNTMQEATILTQLAYISMLLMSGATVPSAMLPNWVQTLAEFTPAAYLVSGFQGIFLQNETLLDHGAAVLSLLITLVVGTFLAMRLFRWEKEERIRPRNKLWALAALAPFLLLGSYSALTGYHVGRGFGRSRAFLIRDARIFTGDKVIEHGSVLVRNGKIAAVYEGAAPAPDALGADLVDASGKTLLPGLIDANAHLAAPGGVSKSGDYDPRAAMRRSAAALLYSGVTAVRSAGDGLEDSLKLRSEIARGARRGARLYACGPLLAAHGAGDPDFREGMPREVSASLQSGMARVAKTPDEARRAVRDLKSAGVDCLHTIVDSGWGDGALVDRKDLLIVGAAAEEARARNLPLATRTGGALDVSDAVDFGAASIERGSWRDDLPDSLLERMARQRVYYIPLLAAAEARALYYGRAAFGDSLVEKAVPGNLLGATRAFVSSGKAADPGKAAAATLALDQARANLARVWKAGIPLAAGTDAGRMLVFHGPSLHRELQLWVQAGIPPQTALQAATVNAAKLLHASNRIGSIRKGLEADLLLVDGNPLQDITATERISMVVFQGARIRREGLVKN